MALFSLAFVGGFDLAAEWMGWENLFHCEWNQFGQKVLKYYWPNAISYDDICKTDFTIWRGRIDILTGGFPCQPYSMAGKRQGTEDSRHLWPEMLRAIRECQPTWIVGENVPGLINWSGGLVFEQVQTDLEGEGYEVQPVVLPASSVNAPHRRDRVWFVAYAGHSKSQEWAEFKERQQLELRRQAWSELASFISLSLATDPNDTGSAERSGIDGIWTEENERWNRQPQPEFGTDGNDGPTQNPNENGRGGDERDATNSNGIGLRGQSNGIGEPGFINETSKRTDWTDWPTVSPLRTGNDGFSSRLDGITFPKWRNESIKAGGNAIVPQVALQIFKVIDEMNTPDRT